MKVLIIAHFLPHPPHGGAIQRNINLLKHIAKHHDVYYLTFNQQVHLASAPELQEAIEVVSSYCKLLEVFSIPTDGHPLAWYTLLGANIFSPLPYSVWRYRSKKMRDVIQRVLANTKIDVALVDTIALAQYKQYLRDIPAILCHHNVESTLLFRKASASKNPFAKAYIKHQARKLRNYEATMVPSFSANTAVSELDATELRNLYPGSQIVEVPNGTDTEYFAPIPNMKRINFRLVFAGGMAWYPNSDAMIHFCQNLYPRIKEIIPEVTMDIIGALPPAEVQQAAAQDPSIHVHGFVDDVRPFLQQASVYVVPIRVGGGTRLKILDALSMSKAIVSTCIGAEGIAVTDGYDILLAEDDASFIEKTVIALQNSTLTESLGTAARHTACSKYSWESIAPRLEQTFNSIVGA